jgi:cytoskeleton protein RodZ
MTDNITQKATDTPPLDQNAASVPPTPGEMLRERREMRALSVQQVAEELHLTMHFIRALEEDAYDKLPGDVFARGYLRSYATLLGLDPEKMMHAFNEHVHGKQAKLQAARQKRAARRRKDRNLPWIVFSGVAFVGVAVVLWYFNARPLDGVTGTSESISVTAPQLRSPLSTPVGNAVPLPPGADGDVPAEQDAEAGAEAGTVTFSEALSATPAEQIGEEAVVTLESAAEGGGRTINVESTGSDTLRLQLSGESWIAIDDSDDNQIFRDMLAPGDTLEIRGTAPFNILLGDAAVTVMYLNGQQVDLSAEIRADNSARFRLGM